MELFKIRSSACHHIVGGAINKPTEKQLMRINELQAKEKRTINQDLELSDLLKKRDFPQPLSVGAMTYCKEWLKQQVYGRTKEFSNKYTEKGNICEPEAIDLVSKVRNLGMVSKNELSYDNAYLTGTPDLVLANEVADIKNSWSVWTFPTFEPELPNDDYYWQMQCYMALTGKKIATVNYCLIDAPEEFIDREARSVSYKAGFSEVEIELYDEVYAKMTYADIPDELRVKTYQIDRNDDHIQKIYHRVEMCREYIHSLIKQYGL